METPAEPAQPIASRAHFAMLCSILLVIALFGLLAASRQPSAGSTSGLSGAQLYLPLLAAEWGLFAYVRMGVRRFGGSIAGLISARPLLARALLLDALLGAGLLFLWLTLEYGFDHLAPASSAAARQLLVRHGSDIPLWFALSLSAGFVEELVFRGYLQRQFGALLRSRWLGLLAQALFFGVTHGYQGALPILKITLFGLLFGIVALLRRSLVPGMIAHAAVDMIGGLAAFR